MAARHKKSLFLFSAFLAALMLPTLVFVAPAASQEPGDTQIFGGSEQLPSTRNLLDITAGEASYEIGASNSLGGVVASVINAFLSILGVIFIILMIYAGYLWLTAGGNEDQVGRAKLYIRNAIIGLIVIVAAYAIANFAASIFGGTGGGDNVGGG